LVEGHPQFVINPLLNDTDFQAAIEISSVAISMTGCKKIDRTGPALQSIVQRIRHHDGENGISTKTQNWNRRLVFAAENTRFATTEQA
jgi:hypothetical protein